MVSAKGPSVVTVLPLRTRTLVAVGVGNTNTGDVRFAGTAGEGASAATALVRVMLETVETEAPLESAIRKPRIHHGGLPDVVLIEPRVNGAVRDSPTRRGHELREVPAIGHVNAFYCSRGLKDHGESCAVANDPRGFGLAATAPE